MPMRGIDVFIARAEAHHPRPQPDGTAGHARTRSEVVATPEAATGTKTPRLPSKGTPHNENQEVTQDQLI